MMVELIEMRNYIFSVFFKVIDFSRFISLVEYVVYIVLSYYVYGVFFLSFFIIMSLFYI